MVVTKSDPYSLGKDAGWREFYSSKSEPNPYAYGTEDHDDFETGWAIGWDQALTEFEDEY